MRTYHYKSNRLAALVLAVLMILSVLPLGALAAEDITVGDADALKAAVLDQETKTVTLSGSVQLSEPLTVAHDVTIDLDGHSITADFNPDQVEDPLATIIVSEKAKLTLKGKDGSTVAPASIPEDRSDQCYGIYVDKESSLTVSGSVKIAAADDASSAYMVFLLQESTLVLTDKAGISGGQFGIKIPSVAEAIEPTLVIDITGTVSCGPNGSAAISQTTQPFNTIVPDDIQVTAGSTVLEDLSLAPDTSVKSYSFGPRPAPPAPEPLPAPANNAWAQGSSVAAWDEVSGAKNYVAQLFLNGSADENKVGESVTVTGTQYDFGSLMTADGEYFFKVKAVSDELDGVWSGPSGAYVRDTTPPEISLEAAERIDAAAGSFKLSSSESGEYYFILAAEGSTSPAAADDVINDVSAVHGSCNPEKKTISLENISDENAKAVFLTVVDSFGNKSGISTITIPAFTPPPEPLPAPANNVWAQDSAVAVWDEVSGAKNYVAQLFLNGSADENKIGQSVTVAGTQYDFGTLMNADGRYFFKVKAVSDELDGLWSGESPAFVRDTTPPEISLESAQRIDAASGSFQLTSNESGDYYYILAAERSASPAAADDVINDASAVHGSCSTEKKTIPLENIADNDAKTVYLTAVDSFGNKSGISTITIPAFTPPPEPLPATTYLTWGQNSTNAMWNTVAGAERYEVQLFLDGSADGNKVGESVTVDGIVYDFGSLMVRDGKYYFKVKAVSSVVDGVWSDLSNALVRDATAPTISNTASVRSSASKGSFSFASSESGNYYYILVAEGSTPPAAADDVINDASAVHGVCTGAKQTVSLNNIADEKAREIYLAVIDSFGNKSQICKITVPAYTPAPVEPLAAPSDISWGQKTTKAMWNAVPGAKKYVVQLYLDGSADQNKVGENVTVDGTVYDFGSLMKKDGKYYFKVKAVSDAAESPWSKTSSALVRDTTPPKITIDTPKRTDAKKASFYFTSSEDGDFYFILTAEGSTPPAAADDVIKASGVTHDACTTAKKSVSVNKIPDEKAKTIYLVVVDKAGNKSQICRIDIPAYTPAPVEPLAAPSDISWGQKTTKAMWNAVPGAKKYVVQLYLDGSADQNKVGENVTVDGTVYDFGSLMKKDGKYYFKVKAVSDAAEGPWSKTSSALVRDTTPPKITSDAPRRDDIKKATFFFSSSESGDYYFILTAEGTKTPKADDVIKNTDAIHGACTTAKQAISLNNITDEKAKEIFLVVVDKAGNKSVAYKITIPAYKAAPTPSPTPTPTPSPTPVSYSVTLPSGTGYSVTAVANSSSPVSAGGSFSFTVNIFNGYTRGTGFAVKANNITLTSSNGVYTISDIKENKTVTVTGVVAVQVNPAPAVPAGPSITTTLLPSATMGKPYSQQLTATGGTPITWSCTGSLPQGITLSSTGLLSGTPVTEGSFRFTLKASNSTGSANRQMTLVVTAAEYTVTKGANTNWAKGTQEGITFQGSGNGDYTVRVDGALVPSDKITYSQDKTSVTISPEYLDTLSTGTHTLTLIYPDGNAKAKFNVKTEDRTVPPTVTAQPQSVQVNKGSSAIFTVTSSGSKLNCQWQVDKNDGKGWTDIPGETSASCTVSDVTSEQNGWKYRCVITNASGKAESNAATLTVKEPIGDVPAETQPAKTDNKIGRTILLSMLGVGLAGLGVGAYLFFRRRSMLDDEMDDTDE